jgi:hypothetical protein
MTRNLATERPFLIVTDMDDHPILQSYKVMRATIVPPYEKVDMTPFGTVICLSTTDGFFSDVAHQCEGRFFGLVTTTYAEDAMVEVLPKSKFVTGAKLDNAYIGIPTDHPPITCPEGFWEVTYPHITLVPPNHKIHNYGGMLRNYVFSHTDLLTTENTYVHHAVIGPDKEPHHITRLVRNGMKPVIAGKELEGKRFVYGTRYTVGHAVIM